MNKQNSTGEALANEPISTLSGKNSLGKRVSQNVLDLSSISDMVELKMAIGGQSDRSYNHQLVINKLFDTDSIIFSDEDNQDAYSR